MRFLIAFVLAICIPQIGWTQQYLASASPSLNRLRAVPQPAYGGSYYSPPPIVQPPLDSSSSDEVILQRVQSLKVELDNLHGEAKDIRKAVQGIIEWQEQAIRELQALKAAALTAKQEQEVLLAMLEEGLQKQKELEGILKQARQELAVAHGQAQMARQQAAQAQGQAARAMQLAREAEEATHFSPLKTLFRGIGGLFGG